MDESLLGWICLLGLMSYRFITSYEAPQRVLHKLPGPLPGFLQWHFLFFLFLGLLLARTFHDICWFEYREFGVSGNGMNERGDEMFRNLNTTVVGGRNSTMGVAERESLMLYSGVARLSLLAPIFGTAAYFIVAYQVFMHVKHGHDQNHHKPLPWKPTRRQNLVLLVLAMPVVFITMSMRAEIRMWSVMTGTAWLPPREYDWKQMKRLQLASYTADLELASTFQFYTIYSFGRLMISFLEDAPSEYQWVLQIAGLQGLDFYILIGVVRSILNLVVAVLSEKESTLQQSENLQNGALAAINPVMTAATLLCVYNMVVVMRMKDIKVKFQGAMNKFQATRALLIIAQMQGKVLLGLTVGSPLYITCAKLPDPFNHIVDHWDFSTERAQLTHASLLGFECFLVACFHMVFWGKNTGTGASKSVQDKEKQLNEAKDKARKEIDNLPVIVTLKKELDELKSEAAQRASARELGNFDDEDDVYYDMLPKDEGEDPFAV